ncbi:phosphohydrolase [Cupriavidus necator]|uniref:Phosphohydrolase n=1 Tax=Cupriavidus necator TaxID=106590 RepID=A0A1U9UNK0_CUPNE|nr:HD domain-containing protein [Cupriavidus necator]AQV94007.1 phosphohydrolase [Cupriavidus necator]
MGKTATFTRMQDSTKEDWDIIYPQAARFADALPNRVLSHLQLLAGESSGYPIDRFQHSLQAATLALKDRRDEEYVVCALLHDIGDTLGSYNHPEIAAAILRPFVSEENLWMVRHHAVFQGYNYFHFLGLDRNMRDRFKDSPYYERTKEFVDQFDNPAFDAGAETYPLSVFEPMVRRVMVPKRSNPR